MQRFLDLSVQTFTGDDESELDRKIEDISTQMDKYTKTVDCIRTNNIENFRHIQHILHPPDNTRHVKPQVSMPMSFKPYQDLRPSLLVRNCTLNEVEHFIEKSANYMRSGPNQIIPPGALKLTGLHKYRPILAN